MKISGYHYTSPQCPTKSKTKIFTGRWFDGGQPASLVVQESDPDFAPEFMLIHPEKYPHLLVQTTKVMPASTTTTTTATTARPPLTKSKQRETNVT